MALPQAAVILPSTPQSDGERFFVNLVSPRVGALGSQTSSGVESRTTMSLLTSLEAMQERLSESSSDASSTEINAPPIHSDGKSWHTLNLADLSACSAMPNEVPYPNAEIPQDNRNITLPCAEPSNSLGSKVRGILDQSPEYTDRSLWGSRKSLEDDLREAERPILQDTLQHESFEQTEYVTSSPESTNVAPQTMDFVAIGSDATIPVVLEDIKCDELPLKLEPQETELHGDQLARRFFDSMGKRDQRFPQNSKEDNLFETSLIPGDLERTYRCQDEKAFKSAIYTYHFLLYLLTHPDNKYGDLITWMSLDQPTDRPTSSMLFKILNKKKTVDLWSKASYINCSLVMKATWGNLTSRMRYAQAKGYKFFDRVQSDTERCPRKRMFRFGEWAQHLLHELQTDSESVHSRLDQKLVKMEDVLSNPRS